MTPEPKCMWKPPSGPTGGMTVVMAEWREPHCPRCCGLVSWGPSRGVCATGHFIAVRNAGHGRSLRVMLKVDISQFQESVNMLIDHLEDLNRAYTPESEV